MLCLYFQYSYQYQATFSNFLLELGAPLLCITTSKHEYFCSNGLEVFFTGAFKVINSQVRSISVQLTTRTGF